jgi:hypothetical protein
MEQSEFYKLGLGLSNRDATKTLPAENEKKSFKIAFKKKSFFF